MSLGWRRAFKDLFFLRATAYDLRGLRFRRWHLSERRYQKILTSVDKKSGKNGPVILFTSDRIIISYPIE